MDGVQTKTFIAATPKHLHARQAFHGALVAILAIGVTHRFWYGKVESLAARITYAAASLYAVRKVLAWIALSAGNLGTKFRNDPTVAPRAIKALKERGFEVTRLTLQKGGVDYDGFLISKGEKNIWTLQATSAGMNVEHFMVRCAEENHKYGSHTLLINHAGVGSSGGWSTVRQMRGAFEAGLEYLEQDIKKIVLRGWSLGAGVLAEVVNHHEFKDSITYAVVSDRTFCRYSDVAAALIHPWIKHLFWLLGVEFDAVKAANRLNDLGICHLIVENPHGDGIIHRSATLGYHLKETNTRKFIHDPYMPHADGHSEEVKKSLFSYWARN